ncbi:MAG: 30S ribosomal protein S20 [Spirochaetes bacterium]|nr:30S ribosomal protein S20 [Spirochaetota bacterium]
MAIHMSVLKRERQNKVRRLRNRIMKSKVHTAFKNLLDAIQKKDRENTDKCLKAYYSVVDKAVKKGIFHKNKGARIKSNATVRANQVK